MVGGKREKRSKANGFSGTGKHKLSALGFTGGKTKSKSKNKIITHKSSSNDKHSKEISNLQPMTTASQQLQFFLHQYESANNIQISSLELESITEACILKLSESLAQDTSTLGEHMKASFGPTWKEVLCKKPLLEVNAEHGSPALLIISSSALRALELLRSLRPLTRECSAAKLFSKHMKVEDQVSLLKNHVNIASGTPSRIKKLIDMEALGLSRLAVIVIDMHTDVKGYSLLTLPQVRDEFWDLYKNYLHQRLLRGDLRICLYGTIPVSSPGKKKDR